MIPTGKQIADSARLSFLGETEIAGGQRFTNGVLTEPIRTAYRLLFSQLMRVDDRKVKRTAFYNLPAYTTYLLPANMGIGNLGAPKALWDRRVGSTWTATVAALNVATATTPQSVDLTITGHGLNTGAQVVAFNFSALTADMTDIWYIQAVDANTIRLLGCGAAQADAATAAVGSTGVISNSNEDWPRDPVEGVFDVYPVVNAPNSNLVQWAWKDGAFRFSPSITARQLKIEYNLSGEYGTDLTKSTGIDNSAEFLACYAAALAANALGHPTTASQLFTMAVGNTTGDPGDADGGYLGAFIRPLVKAQQNVRVVMPPFRQRRNTGWPIGF